MSESTISAINSHAAQSTSGPKSGSMSGAISIIAIEIDEQVFYMPQNDLITFENRQSLRPPSTENKAVACLEIANQDLPVYCLSAEFELLKDIPDERSVCIVMACGDHRLGLLCDKIHKLDFQQIRIENIPVCMRTKNTPLNQLFLYRDEAGRVDMGMMLRNDSLIKYLDMCENRAA